MRVGYRTAIPLIGKSRLDGQLRNNNSPIAHALRGTLTPSSVRNLVEQSNNQSRPYAVIKPGRRLGGAWMDELVSNRKIVTLCGGCIKKYGPWWKKVAYEPRMDVAISDCDGCGQELQFCRDFFYSRLLGD